jgi:hypothetical protein
MKNKSLRYSILVLLVLFVSLTFACATDQGARKEEKPKQETAREERAQEEMKARVLESSWYEGANYHRGRDDTGGVEVGEWVRNRKEMKAKQEETDKRLAKLENQAEGQQPVTSQEQTAGTQAKAAETGLVAYGAANT